MCCVCVRERELCVSAGTSVSPHTCGGQRITLLSWFLCFCRSVYATLVSSTSHIATAMLRLQRRATTSSFSHMGSGVKFGSPGLQSKRFYPLRHVDGISTPTSFNASLPCAPVQPVVWVFGFVLCQGKGKLGKAKEEG